MTHIIVTLLVLAQLTALFIQWKYKKPYMLIFIIAILIIVVAIKWSNQ